MNSFIENMYFMSPLCVQNALVSLYGLKLYRERYIGGHSKYLSSLLNSQWLDSDQMRRFVDQKFIEIINHAVNSVPFYKKLVSQGKLDPKKIKGINDLKRFPIITKEEIRETPEDFLSSEIPKNQLIVVNTSGTTGKTLKIYIDKNSRRYAYAFFSRLKMWAGIDNNKKNITFAGRIFIKPDQKEPPFYRKNYIMNNYLFSSYHICNATIGHYVQAIKEINPHFIDSYPSSLYTIAKYMKDNQINGVTPKAIITSSETLFNHQREVIENVFGCKVFDQYGSAEQVAFVSQCEYGEYHIHPEFGTIEFLNNQWEPAKPGEDANIICTGFTNKAMPLFRYEIGDTGIFADRKCRCGRNFPIIEKIVGRTDDVIIGKGGKRLERLDPVFKGLTSIKEAQIIQEKIDYIILKIVPGNSYQQSDSDIIVKELKKRISHDLVVDVNIVDEIERTQAGKFRAVISKVNQA
jgi:phenylacetate-CoA ligase